MLAIKSIQEKSEQERICGLCGVEFDVDCLAYAAWDTQSVEENGELLGVCQFRILGKYGIIYDLKNKIGVKDLEALIIMGKGALNFIDLCGIHDAIIKEESEKLPKLLGFKQDKIGENDENEIWYVDLRGYFESPCKKIRPNGE